MKINTGTQSAVIPDGEADPGPIPAKNEIVHPLTTSNIPAWVPDIAARFRDDGAQVCHFGE